jgi:hypothetical protein
MFESEIWSGVAGNILSAVIASSISLIVMRRTIKQNNKIYEDNKKDALKPMIVLRNTLPASKFRTGNLKAIHIKDFQNIGNGYAVDINVISNYGEFFKGEGESYWPFVLQNGAKADEVNLVSDQLHSLIEGQHFTLKISYKDIYGNQYQTNYILECTGNAFRIMGVKFN